MIAVNKIKKIRQRAVTKFFHNFSDKFSISRSFENFFIKSFSKLIIVFFFITYLNFADLDGLFAIISSSLGYIGFFNFSSNNLF